MMIEQQGNTVDDAIEEALKKMGMSREKVKVEVVAEGKKGVFGLGAQVAIVRVSTIEEKDKQIDTSREYHPEQSIREEDKQDRQKRTIPDEESSGIKFLQEVFKSLGMEVKLQASINEEGTEVINIISSDSALLIGKKGKNLDALQYLTNIIVNTDTSKKVKVLLDSEGYREKRKESLLTLVKKVSEEVKQTGNSVSLEPMSAYERRIVHLTLKENPDITTESIGEGEERRVVIKLRKEN